MYWYAKEKCSDGGCPMTGDPDLVGSAPTLAFTQSGEFKKLAKDFPATGFSAVYNGKVGIVEGGVYEFMLRSSDGSILWLDGYDTSDIVVDNWGKHAQATKTGSKYLGKGWHEINIEYF